MSSITTLVPIRVDASSSDGAVHIIDTLLIDTNCLPISQPSNYNSNQTSSLSTLSKETDNSFSLPSLIDSNATHLTETILADAEVYGTSRSNTKSYMGGRLDLLSDTKLYSIIYKQINTQLAIALGSDKKNMVSNTGYSISGVKSDGEAEENSEQQSNIVRIKIRLRQDGFVVFDEFDYDVNSSGIEGCDPFSIATALVTDLKLPIELTQTIASSIVEQIYGVNVTESLSAITSDVIRNTPSALSMNETRDGTANDFASVMLQTR